MLRRSFLFAGAAFALLLGSTASTAVAGGIQVTQDDGVITNFTAINLGGGVIEFDLSGIQAVTHVNGLSASNISAQFDPVIKVTLSVSGSDVTVTGNDPSPFTKKFTDLTGSASLTYDLGSTASAITDPHGLSLVGKIIGLSGVTTTAYDYAPLLGGINQISFNGSSFTGLGNDVNNQKVSMFLATTGSTWTGNVLFSESNVIPEPASLALLGIGLSGLLTFRRFLKRTSFA